MKNGRVAAALTGCAEKEAVSGEGSSDNSSYSPDTSSNNSSNSSVNGSTSTTLSDNSTPSSVVSSVTSSNDTSVTSTTETSSDSGNTVSEATSTTSAGNNEPSVIISTITDNSNPQEQWTERTFEAPVTFYVNQNNVNSRSKPIQGSSVIKTYSLNEKVMTVSETDTYYFKLEDGSYVHSDYLSKNPVEIKDTNLKIGDKNSKGYTIIGFTSDGTPYIGIDENYEKKGNVIVDYIEGLDEYGNQGKWPIYKSDPEKEQELYDSRDHGNLEGIVMGH